MTGVAVKTLSVVAFGMAALILALPSSAQASSGTAQTTNSGTAPAPVVPTSGLSVRHLKAGVGESPLPSDKVRVHYRGTFPDGREFDSSYARGKPAEFPLSRVIRCWTEGVQTMKVGGKAQLVCPPELAYGARGTPGGPIPPNATLHFEVELLEIVR